jgi:hypothetical protein
MAQVTINGWNVVTPDSIAWAFNPNYIEITTPSGSVYPYVVITIGDNSPIKAVFYNHHTKIYISRLLQICFDSPKTERVKSIRVLIETQDVLIDGVQYYGWEVSNTLVTTVWGGINLGERAYNYGVYNYEQGHGWLTSHIQCFVNFPFTLELLIANGSTLNRRAGTSGYTQVGAYNDNRLVTLTKNDVLGNLTQGRVVYRQDLSSMNEGGTFDNSFDYTFHTPADTTVITHVHLRQEQEGYFLRWISHFGFMQYYLFDKGDHVTKTQKTATLPEEVRMDGMYFGGSARNLSVKSTRNLKMCAMNLNPDTLDYVQDIVASPFVDMYIGLDKQGNEIWQPVKVADNSYTVKTLHNYLCDFEINVELPDNVTQVL